MGSRDSFLRKLTLQLSNALRRLVIQIIIMIVVILASVRVARAQEGLSHGYISATVDHYGIGIWVRIKGKMDIIMPGIHVDPGGGWLTLLPSLWLKHRTWKNIAIAPSFGIGGRAFSIRKEHGRWVMDDSPRVLFGGTFHWKVFHVGFLKDPFRGEIGHGVIGIRLPL